jgi:predicted GIY-YIG superfamily endonuclease
MKQQGIYILENPNKHYYVGQTIDLTKRIEKYRNYRCKSQPGIYNSLKEHRIR